jgi:hypothetical protein
MVSYELCFRTAFKTQVSGEQPCLHDDHVSFDGQGLLGEADEVGERQRAPPPALRDDAVDLAEVFVQPRDLGDAPRRAAPC